MKFVELKNVSGKRISITQIRDLTFEPGESRKVHPSTATHPVVSRYIQSGMLNVSGEISKEEPKKVAPVVAAPAKTEKPAPQVNQPIAVPVEQPVEAVEPPIVQVEEPTIEGSETSGEDLRALYISAPGITEDNVNVVMEKYPTLSQFKQASMEELLEIGISKNQTKRIMKWLAEN